MKTKLIRVTQEIINKANVTDSRNCLIYWAMFPLIKKEYQESLEVGVSIFEVGKENFELNRLVSDFIVRAFNGEVKPSSFKVKIPEKYLA